MLDRRCLRNRRRLLFKRGPVHRQLELELPSTAIDLHGNNLAGLGQINHGIQITGVFNWRVIKADNHITRLQPDNRRCRPILNRSNLRSDWHIRPAFMLTYGIIKCETQLTRSYFTIFFNLMDFGSHLPGSNVKIQPGILRHIA